MAKPAGDPPETVLVKLWQHHLLGGGLVTEEGEPLRVLYPGRINDGHGADLLDAVISTRRGVVRGDVEVHVRSGDWAAHRHHRDPAYNGVILHVVFRRDDKVSTSLENGRQVPILALRRYLGRRPGRRPLAGRGMPCQRVEPCDTGARAEFLDRVGKERFLAKAGEFGNGLLETAADQVLYQGIAAALGYAKNKIPCLELARRLPLRTLVAVTDGTTSDEECLVRQQAMLLGTAGLLPSQRSLRRAADTNDCWPDRLEAAWAAFGKTPAMGERGWQLFKVRPNNLPQRRLVGISYLLRRYREEGLLEGLIRQVRELPVGAGAELKKALVVIAQGYWANHFDFGRPTGRPVPALIGHARADDIAVNVLLPFAAAWSRLVGEPGISAKAMQVYRDYPQLAVNTVERHMRGQLGLSAAQVNSARRQQGLLHVYRTLCSQGGCGGCALANP